GDGRARRRLGPGHYRRRGRRSRLSSRGAPDAPLLALDRLPQPRPGDPRGAPPRPDRHPLPGPLPGPLVGAGPAALDRRRGPRPPASRRARAGVPAWWRLRGGPRLGAAGPAWAVPAPRRWLALAAIPLFAVAWAAKGELGGQSCALALSALACVTLGWLLVC